MKNLVIAAIITLFCSVASAAPAAECKSPAGTFTCIGQQLSSTCPSIPKTLNYDNVKVEATKCGAEFKSTVLTLPNGCLARLSVLTIFEATSIGAYQVIDMVCPKTGVRCQAIHKISFASKKAEPTRQEADTELP